MPQPSPRFAHSAISNWPAEAASRVRFLSASSGFTSTPYQYCTVLYDPVDSLLQIVAVDKEDNVAEILDVIDPDDLIGAQLEIDMNLDFESPKIEPLKDRDSNEPASNTLSDTKGSATLTLFCYPRVDASKRTLLNRLGITKYIPQTNTSYNRSNNIASRVAHHRSLKLAPAEDFSDCSTLVKALRQLANFHHSQHEKEKGTADRQKYLIVVNPFAGNKKNAEQVCNSQVKPMMEQAGLEVDVLVTDHAQHAQEAVGEDAGTDICRYDALILMGGDGIIHEVYNGLFSRKDAKKVMQKLKIGIVGCGSCNGFATSIATKGAEHYGALTDAFLIAKGACCWHDISNYQSSTQSYTSFLTFSYGIIADIDIESEVLRWLGEFRNDIWGVLKVLQMPKYPATFSYLSPPKNSNSDEDIDLPPLTENVPDTWTKIEDDFYLFWASQVSHAAMHTHHAPSVEFGDGIFSVMIVRGSVSRYRMARILLGLESATHVEMPCVEIIPCVAYRFIPAGPGSFNDLDGEVVEPGPIQAKVLPRCVQVFSNPQRKQS